MRIITLTAAALALTAGVASAASFTSVDRNDDGLVSKAEFLQIYGPDLDTSSFRYIDQNHDGAIDTAEFADAERNTHGPLAQAE